MVNKKDKNIIRQRIHKRIREKVSGTAETPRVNVFRSNSNIYVQVIDDVAQNTIASSSTKLLKLSGANIENAIRVGTDIGEKLLKLNITKVVFDRGGYQYHGKIKALADAIRAAGIVF